MTLNVSSIGDNPQQPSANASTYIPDQLIAGNAKVITDTVTVGGSQTLKRGAVLGQAAFGAISASAGTAQGSGTIAVAAAPAVGDTLTVNGTVITMVAQSPVGNQLAIGPFATGPALTAAQVAVALLAFLIGSTDTNIAKMSYTLSGSTITATSLVTSTAGNAYTLATSNSSAFTLSGGTLTGGTANTGNATVGSISGGSTLKPGQYKAVCLTATTAQVYSPTGVELGVATFGTAFKDAEINFTITAGGTPCVAGDAFLLQSAPGSSYVLAVASAVDGSEVPDVILADDCDPTGGAVLAPVYLQGEFNVNAMTFGAGITAANAKSVLRLKGIFLKNAVTAADPS